MSRTIIKIPYTNKSYYLEWSSIVGAPVTSGMLIDDFKKFYKEIYGTSSMDDLERRLKRVEEYGTSSIHGESVDSVIAFNRAGDKENQLTLSEIIQKYIAEPNGL